MTWRLVDDVWGLIVGELSSADWGRLAQVHPHFWWWLQQKAEYQAVCLTFTKNRNDAFLIACRWRNWTSIDLYKPTLEPETLVKGFLQYYPQTLEDLWPRIPLFRQYSVIRSCFEQGRLELTDQLARSIDLSPRNLSSSTMFITAASQNFSAILPFLSTFCLPLVEAIFLALSCSGECRKLKELYALRPQISEDVLSCALYHSQNYHYSITAKWLKRLLAAN